MVLRLLRRLVDDGQTVVMVTHDAGAAALADRVVFLRDGDIVDEVAGGDGARVADALRLLQTAGDSEPGRRHEPPPAAGRRAASPRSPG